MDFNDLFKQTKISHAFKSTKKIVTVRTDNTLNEILELFSNYNIYSAPVIDFKGTVIFLIDMMDIVNFIVLNCGISTQLTEDFINNGTESFSQFLNKNSEVFSKSTCESIIYGRANRLKLVNENEKIQSLVETFSDHITKVFICNDAMEIVNIISPSDVLSIMAQNIHYLDAQKRKCISNIGGVEKEIQRTFSQTTKVITVLLEFLKYGITSAPILDKHSRLVGNFSISNMKGLSQGNFSELILSVWDYLKLQNIREKRLNISSLHENSFHPLISLMTDPIDYVIYKLVATKVHQLYIVDYKNQPVSVITINQLIQVLSLKSMDTS